jgi:hypothetical protein
MICVVYLSKIRTCLSHCDTQYFLCFTSSLQYQRLTSRPGACLYAVVDRENKVNERQKDENEQRKRSTEQRSSGEVGVGEGSGSLGASDDVGGECTRMAKGSDGSEIGNESCLSVTLDYRFFIGAMDGPSFQQNKDNKQNTK